MTLTLMPRQSHVKMECKGARIFAGMNECRNEKGECEEMTVRRYIQIHAYPNPLQ